MQKFRRKSADVQAVRYAEPEGIQGPDYPAHPLPGDCEWRQFGSTWKPTVRPSGSIVCPGDWIVVDANGTYALPDGSFRESFDLVGDATLAVSINGEAFHCTAEEAGMLRDLLGK